MLASVRLRPTSVKRFLLWDHYSTGLKRGEDNEI